MSPHVMTTRWPDIEWVLRLPDYLPTEESLAALHHLLQDRRSELWDVDAVRELNTSTQMLEAVAALLESIIGLTVVDQRGNLVVKRRNEEEEDIIVIQDAERDEEVVGHVVLPGKEVVFYREDLLLDPRLVRRVMDFPVQGMPTDMFIFQERLEAALHYKEVLMHLLEWLSFISRNHVSDNELQERAN